MKKPSSKSIRKLSYGKKVHSIVIASQLPFVDVNKVATVTKISMMSM